MGALSFIQSLEEHVSGDIEAITVRTIGVKNFDVHRQLVGRQLPREVIDHLIVISSVNNNDMTDRPIDTLI